jgi:hypothetical protein
VRIIDIGSFLIHSLSQVSSQITEIKQLTDQYRVSLSVTTVSTEHPQIAVLDFSRSALRELFNYGDRCAENEQLWTSVDQLLSTKADPGTPVGITDRWCVLASP